MFWVILVGLIFSALVLVLNIVSDDALFLKISAVFAWVVITLALFLAFVNATNLPR